jgi:hypothetical protein
MIREEFIIKETKVDTGLLKWLSLIFDTYNDFYFPWDKIDKYILTYNEMDNSEYIKTEIKKIQLGLIDGFEINNLFKKHFGVDLFLS